MGAHLIKSRGDKMEKSCYRRWRIIGTVVIIIYTLFFFKEQFFWGSHVHQGRDMSPLPPPLMDAHVTSIEVKILKST